MPLSNLPPGVTDRMIEKAQERKPQTHYLKSWPENFHRLMCGYRLTDVRLDDRDIQDGDKVIFQEYDQKLNSHTGKEMRMEVIDVIRGAVGIERAYCVLCLFLRPGVCYTFNEKLIEGIENGRKIELAASESGSAPSGERTTEERISNDSGIQQANP